MQNIESLRFRLMSPEMIRSFSVCEVSRPGLYFKSKPREHGLLDERMGSLNSYTRCRTCGHTSSKCPGHFGHIEIPSPFLYLPCAVDSLYKILQRACFHCGELLFGSNRVCLKCAKDETVQQPTFTKQGYFLFIRRSEKSQQEFFFAKDCLDVLSRITPETYRSLGFEKLDVSHPKFAILRYVLVPPLCIRPTVKVTGSSKTRGQDSITLRFLDLMKVCKQIQQHPTSSKKFLEAVKDAQNVLAMIHDKGEENTNTKRNRTCRSLTSRLKGKKGRIRHSCLGKRVEFSSRSVISGSGTSDIWELGVPESIALTQTKNEIINEYNRARLMQRIYEGPNCVRGAVSVTNKKNQVFMLSKFKEKRMKQLAMVKNGWTVQRYLANKDLVLFNRQPTLSKYSMMAHSVYILPPHISTFVLNTATTPPYNADFDGDEMNMHVPTSGIRAELELQHLMHVQNNLISCQASNLLISLIQDGVVGLYILTAEDTILDQEEFWQLQMAVHYPQQRAPKPFLHCGNKSGGAKLYTGKQVLSLMLPATFTMRTRDFEVVRGTLVKGQLHKAHLKKILTALAHENQQQTSQIISDLQRVCCTFLKDRGFSTGLHDFEMEPGADEKIEEAVRKEVDKGDFWNVLQRSGMKAVKLSKRQNESNGLFTMVAARSKGSNINVANILATLGQQIIDGNSQISLYKNMTLPCFGMNPTKPEARGFIYNSYQRGLNNYEVFFHLMAGREGLVGKFLSFLSF